jgi:hypothetical protein
MRVGGEHHPSSVSPRKREQVYIVEEIRWDPGSPKIREKSRSPSEFNPRTVQPVASRYTDCATRDQFRQVKFVLRKVIMAF